MRFKEEIMEIAKTKHGRSQEKSSFMADIDKGIA